MNNYFLGPGVEFDLESIWDFIARDDVNAADRWLSKLYDAFELIARSPGIGHTRRDLTVHSVLFWPVDAYLIIYRVQVDLVEVVAVTQGSRDIPSFLRRQHS